MNTLMIGCHDQRTQTMISRCLLLTSVSLALSLSACVQNRVDRGENRLDRQAVDTVITLDGDMRDWPGASAAVADEHHLYMRFSVQDERYTLQSDSAPTAIMIDADANRSTGYQVESDSGLAALGVDLVVEFSPIRSEGSSGRGVVLYALGNDGTRTPLSVYDWDFSCAPTYASQWYEVRISRTPSGDTPVPQAGLLTSGTISGAFVRYDGRGRIVASSEVFSTAAGPCCMDGARRSDLEVPKKEPNVLRVMSYNVLRSSPLSKPEPFKRIFEAVKPDVILVQEWEAGSAREFAGWFNEHLMREGGWDVVADAGKVAEGGGVAIVTKYPAKTVTNDLQTSSSDGSSHRVRFALGYVETPMGNLLAGSVHLKSRGSAGSPEDTRRVAEAAAINTAVREATSGQKPAFVFVGGDMNLVGSFAPLETMIAAGDLDGSDLTIATPRTLGDRTSVTWSEKGNEFSPGRLDYIVYSDSRASVVRSFVLDTSRLSAETLAACGLEAGDCADASDHLPVVVDFILK